MACCGKIGEILKKVVSALKPILQVLLLAVAAYVLIFDGGATLMAYLKTISWLPAVLTGLSATTLGYLALGMAVLVDPAQAGEWVGDAASAVGEIAGDVIGAAAGGLASGLVSSPLGMLALAAGVYFLFFSGDRKAKDSPAKANDSPASVEIAQSKTERRDYGV